MKRAAPIGIGFIVILPLIAVLRSGENGGRMQSLQPRRVVEFKSAMTEALKVDEDSKDEFNNLISTLPNVNLTPVSNFTCILVDSFTVSL